MGVAAGGAGFVLPLARLRGTAAVAIVVATFLDLLTPSAAGISLVAIRGAAGLAEGVLIWLTIGLIVRSAIPARLSGAYLAVQTLAQLAIASVLGFYVIPAAGSYGGFATLAIASAIGLAALPWMPRRYDPLDREEGAPSAHIPLRGIAALIGVLLYLAFVVAIWVYLEPLARQRGIDHRTIAAIAPLSLAMQVIGASVAVGLAGRVPALPTLIVVGAVNVGLLILIAAPPSDATFLVATSAFGFLWLFALPFQVPAVIAADPSRNAASLIGGAQLVGSSLGPFAASLLAQSGDISRVLWFGMACIALALALIGIASVRRRTA